MSVKTLIADPEFSRLSAEEKQGVLASVDPDFQNIGIGEIDSVVNGIRGSATPKPSGYSIPPLIQKAAQMLTTPIRGFRAMGVGAQRAMQDVSPRAMLPLIGSMTPTDVASIVKNAPMALDRASAAVKPGFLPQVGERTGSMVGEAAGTAGLMAPIAAIAPGSLAIQSGVGAATTGGLSATMDASEEGRFFPKRTAVNAAVGGLLPILASEGLNNAAAKTAGAIGKIQSGVPSKFGERLYKDPGAFLSSTEKTAGQKLGIFRTEKGLSPIPRTTEEIVDSEASVARRVVKEIDERLEKGIATAKDLLKGKQSVDDIIEATPIKQTQKRAGLFELKNKFTDALENVISGDKAASKEFSRSMLAGKFRKALPVTAQGDISLTRTLFLPSFQDSLPGAVGSVVAGAAQSPLLGGSAISAAGGAHKVVQAALKNPVIKPAMLSAVRQLISQSEIKKLIKQFKKANPSLSDDEVRDLARKQADRENKTWDGKE